MTLLAVREIFDTPMLIGDTLLSSELPGKPHIPTQPPNRLLDFTSTNYGYIPSNTYRKVYILSENFVIGWAGDLWSATDLLIKIYSNFFGHAVTIEAWEKFIIGPHPDVRADVVLAGWIIEKGTRLAFRWMSKYPSKLEKDFARGACFSDGTGADFARRTLGEPEEYTTTAIEGWHKAILCMLDGVSQLVAFELLDGSNLLNLFGLCYEVIVFDGNKFSYINDINYLHYHFTWYADRPNQLEGGIVRFLTHYKNFGEYACCTISNHTYDPHFNGFFVIKPIFGEKSRPNWAPANRLHQGFDAEFFCNFINVDASDGKNMYMPYIVQRGSPDLPIEYIDEGEDTYIKRYIYQDETRL